MAVFKGTILPRLLPLASHYSAVVEWCEVGEVSDIGLVNKIFCLYTGCFISLVPPLKVLSTKSC